MNSCRPKVVVFAACQEALTIALIHDEHDLGGYLRTKESRLFHAVDTRIFPLREIIWRLDRLDRSWRLAETAVAVVHIWIQGRRKLAGYLEVVAGLHHILGSSNEEWVDTVATWVVEKMTTLTWDWGICARRCDGC